MLVDDAISGQAFVEPVIVPGVAGSNLLTASVFNALTAQLFLERTPILPDMNVLSNITDMLSPFVSSFAKRTPLGSIQLYDVALFAGAIL